jgi:NAD(P)-dependent dehydrogenase (short-subunit alcohol dehydrogenase family)
MMKNHQGSENTLAEKVVLITGAAGLLGAFFAEATAREGSTVVLVDVNTEKGENVTSAIRKKTGNQKVLFERCDITDTTEVDKLVERIVEKFGKIDGLINNAYPRNKNYGKKFEEVTYADFCENVDMHLGGYFLMSQRIGIQMMKQKSGNIINMGSIYGFAAPRFDVYEGTPMTMPVEYAAIKGGILNLTTYLASYLGGYNVRVNTISPGGIWDKQPDDFVKKYSEKVLLGKRMANPEDVTGVVLFLLSEASGYVTGQNIVVDGGWSL